MNVSNILIKRLASEIKRSGESRLIPRDYAEELSKALEGKSRNMRVRLVFPQKIYANLSTDLGETRYVRCVLCGKIFDLSARPRLIITLKCPSCGGALAPAPVWPIASRSFVRNLSVSEGRRVLLPIQEWFDRIIISRKERPVASMTFIDRRGQSISVDRHFVRWEGGRGSAFYYILSLMPSESITRPISITAFAPNTERCRPIRVLESLYGIEEILFCDELEIIQVTVGYRAGHPRSPASSRVTFILTEDEVRLPTRYLVTKGLVIRLNEDQIKDRIDNFDKRRWEVVHTLSHAFLVSLPQITGLGSDDFGEALNVNGLEFSVYDNAMGGIGGIEGVVIDDNLNPNYEAKIRESGHCPLECMKACKACLFTDSCYMLNHNLDRRIIISLGWRELY